MCMWIFDQKYNPFLSCLLVSLPTLAGEFYWMILCCVCVYVWPEVTCFSLCLLTLMLASASEFIEWFCVYVCIFDQCVFLSWSAHSGSIANNQEVNLWSLFYVWQEVTRFSPCLLSPLPTSASEFYWMALCCVCVCLTRSNLFLSLSAYSNANNSEWALVKWSCVD